LPCCGASVNVAPDPLICRQSAKIEFDRVADVAGRKTMDLQSPPVLVQLAQEEAPPEQPVEPTPIKVDVSKYIPESATAVTMIVTLTPPTGQAIIYAEGHEKDYTLFKGPRSIEEVKLNGPIVYVKLYGATSFDIRYTNYRQPY
jgi:hypothetical protein